ncbi:ABC-type transport auxiliary lipoprotein family protein [Stappia stellulata]|uniref:ABC-type transport auxiliary lipoprotein family protein n=1 Tax=Stappia stellulata TaxID=71235 RepID=UPI00040DEB8A|nr:ABC-type transport auxiliary lipoprotein family protein [Stappia stellulata]
MSFARISAAIVGMALLISLGGCAANNTPEAYYGLSAPTDLETQTRSRSGARQVLVPEPRALQALDTANIAVVDDGPVYTYFPKAAWTDTLPKVVQAKMVRALENTRGLRGVGLPGEGLLIDYQLQTDLRAFELRVDGRDRAVVEIMARLVNDRNGRTRASRIFRAEAPAKSTSVRDAVSAMNAAADAVLREMSAWVLGNV